MSNLKLIINYSYLLQSTVITWIFITSPALGFTAFKKMPAFMHIWPLHTYTRIIIVKSNQALKYRQFILKNPKRIVIDLRDVNLNSLLKHIKAQISNNNPHIKSTRIGQFNQHTVRVVLELKPNVKSRTYLLAPFSHFKECLLIDLYPNKIHDVRNSLLVPLKNYNKDNFFRLVTKVQNYSQACKTKQNKPIIVMLDPGHGGEDSGAIGRFHTQEKNIALQIARHLKTLIDYESNMCAYMTRNKDVFIPLRMRIAKAQKQHADLFVSIHTNAFTSRKPSGSSVFAFSTQNLTSARTGHLTNVQNTSNFTGGINKNGNQYIDHTIFDIVQSLNVIDSLKFGKAVLSKLSKVNQLHKNNVAQADFTVLKSPDIPSILIETAFISNTREENKLKTVKFQQAIAKSILSGIKVYLSDSMLIEKQN